MLCQQRPRFLLLATECLAISSVSTGPKPNDKQTNTPPKYCENDDDFFSAPRSNVINNGIILSTAYVCCCYTEQLFLLISIAANLLFAVCATHCCVPCGNIIHTHTHSNSTDIYFNGIFDGFLFCVFLEHLFTFADCCTYLCMAARPSTQAAVITIYHIIFYHANHHVDLSFSMRNENNKQRELCVKWLISQCTCAMSFRHRNVLRRYGKSIKNENGK